MTYRPRRADSINRKIWPIIALFFLIALLGSAGILWMAAS